MQRLEMDSLTPMKTSDPNLSPRAPMFHSVKPRNLPREPYVSSCTEPNNDPIVVATSRIRCAVEDAEISIFDAQKYFNECGEEDDQDHHRKDHIVVSPPAPQAFRRISSVSSGDGYGRNYRSSARSFRSTRTTVSSEASWNSQSGLLSKPPPGSVSLGLENVNVDDEKRSSSSGNVFSPKWIFRLKCPCTGKRSVQVEGKLSHSHDPRNCIGSSSSSPSFLKRVRNSKPLESAYEKESENRLKECSSIAQHLAKRPGLIKDCDDGFSSQSNMSRRIVTDAPAFSFPISRSPPSMKSMPTEGLLPTINDSGEEDPSRHSLEVFKPREFHKDRRSFGFPPARPKSPTTADDNYDVGSDASSDLFEIESFSTQPPASILNP